MSDYGDVQNSGVKGDVHIGDTYSSNYNRTEIRHEEHIDHRTNIGIQQNLYRTDVNAITYDTAKDVCIKHGSKVTTANSTYSHDKVLQQILESIERGGGLKNSTFSILWPWKSESEGPTISAFYKTVMSSKVLEGYYPVLINEKASEVLKTIKHEGVVGLRDFEEYKFFLSREFVKMNKFVFILRNESPSAIIELQKEIENRKEVKDIKILSVYQMYSGTRLEWEYHKFDLNPKTAQEVDETLEYIKKHRALYGTEQKKSSLIAMELFYKEKQKRIPRDLKADEGKSKNTTELPGITKDSKISAQEIPQKLTLTENPRFFEQNIYEIVRFAFITMSWSKKASVIYITIFMPYLEFLLLGESLLLSTLGSIFSTVMVYVLLRYFWVVYILRK